MFFSKGPQLNMFDPPNPFTRTKDSDSLALVLIEQAKKSAKRKRKGDTVKIGMKGSCPDIYLAHVHTSLRELSQDHGLEYKGWDAPNKFRFEKK